jgi:hypothetical protein
MDYSIGRRQMSSVLCFTVYQAIYRINHLFQNGRALLKCRIFIPPTTGNPDVEKSRSHAPRYDTYVPIVNKHFKTVLYFFGPVFCVPVSCFLCCCRSSTPATVSPIRSESLLIFVLFFSENSTGFDVDYITVCFVSRFLCCC